jgi:hypothetical protein
MRMMSMAERFGISTFAYCHESRFFSILSGLREVLAVYIYKVVSSPPSSLAPTSIKVCLPFSTKSYDYQDHV